MMHKKTSAASKPSDALTGLMIQVEAACLLPSSSISSYVCMYVYVYICIFVHTTHEVPNRDFT